MDEAKRDLAFAILKSFVAVSTPEKRGDFDENTAAK